MNVHYLVEMQDWANLKIAKNLKYRDLHLPVGLVIA